MSDTNLVEAIFLEAIDQPKADLDAFLAERCNADDALKQQVLELLAAHDETGSFLVDKQPAWQCATQDSGMAERVGEQIGPYTLREQIGEGGMGVVYVAEQEKPIRRKVALKVIKPGMDSKAVLARFEVERNALALMNHPNISRVLDAGMMSTGRPYFVMELVNGGPITQYCDEQKIDINERLQLFMDICGAIQHAHHKGIIHRDLKPSNVLITEIDGKPVPKVIDFGVAKALNQSLTDRSLYTAFQTVVGTPLYMSPEQATFSGVDVDTRSDVYSLGVLLYELLTGTTPFSGEDFKKVAIEEVFKLIRESELPRPSNRISSLGDSATRVSQLRRTQPDQLGRSVRGDLDWIVMKALSKERGRRYKTADDLSEDISKHLRNLPVAARPPSFGYRLSRFYCRHRLLVAATCMVLMVTLVLSIVAGRSMWRETQLAAKYREQLYQGLLMKAMSGTAGIEDEIRQAERDGLGDEQIRILRSLKAIYSGTPSQAIDLLEPLVRKSDRIPAHALLAMAYYQSGQLWKGVEQRDVASSLAAGANLSNEDRLFLAYCALGVDRKGVDHIDQYLDEEKSPLGFAVSADVRSWNLGYGDDDISTQTALDHIEVARLILGPTAYTLQVELKLNMEAYRAARASGDDATEYLARAKIAEAELAEKFSNYVWGQFLRGSLWYGLGDYEKAAVVWTSESNDWILSCRGLALIRAGRDVEAMEVAKRIGSPEYQLLLFPSFGRTDEGRELARAAYKEVVRNAVNDATYRQPHVLVAGLFVGVPGAEISATARRWLEMSEEDKANTWAYWDRQCLSFLAGDLEPSGLLAKAGEKGVRRHSAQFFIGAMELIRGKPEVALSELKKGFDPDWDSTFLPSMWCACLADQLQKDLLKGQVTGQQVTDE